MLKKRWVAILFRVMISGLIIGYAFKVMSDKYGSLGKGADHFISAFSDVSFSWIIPAFFLHFAGIALMSLRWKVLLSAQKVNGRYGELYSLNLMAAFFNNFLPSTIGGDAVKAIESKRIVGDHTRSVLVIVIERLTGLFALAVIVLVAVFLKGSGTGGDDGTNPVPFIFLIVSGVVVIGLVSHPKISGFIVNLIKRFFPKKIAEIADRAVSAVSIYYKYPLRLTFAILISILFQLNMVLYYYFISRSLGMSPGFVDFMSKAPILIFLLMTVPSVNGIGVRTAVFGGLMKFPTPIALAVEVVDIGLRFVLGFVGGIVFLFHKRAKERNNTEQG